MPNKKTSNLLACMGLFLMNSSGPCGAPAPAAPIKQAVVLHISSPFQLPDLKPREKAGAIYLMVTINNNARKAPFYSAPVAPGASGPAQLQLPATAQDGVKIQFVTVKEGAIQALSFVYAFSGPRLRCLAGKQAAVDVIYNAGTKLIDVAGVPVAC